MIWTQWVNIPENVDKFKICSNTCARLKVGHDISITLSLSLSPSLIRLYFLEAEGKILSIPSGFLEDPIFSRKTIFFTNVIPYQEHHLKDPVLGIYWPLCWRWVFIFHSGWGGRIGQDLAPAKCQGLPDAKALVQPSTLLQPEPFQCSSCEVWPLGTVRPSHLPAAAVFRPRNAVGVLRPGPPGSSGPRCRAAPAGPRSSHPCGGSPAVTFTESLAARPQGTQMPWSQSGGFQQHLGCRGFGSCWENDGSWNIPLLKGMYTSGMYTSNRSWGQKIMAHLALGSSCSKVTSSCNAQQSAPSTPMTEPQLCLACDWYGLN